MKLCICIVILMALCAGVAQADLVDDLSAILQGSTFSACYAHSFAEAKDGIVLKGSWDLKKWDLGSDRSVTLNFDVATLPKADSIKLGPGISGTLNGFIGSANLGVGWVPEYHWSWNLSVVAVRL